jgi:hypothetical protein
MVPCRLDFHLWCLDFLPMQPFVNLKVRLRTLDCRTATYASKAAATTPNREGHCSEGRQDGRQSHQPRGTEQGLVRWTVCALRSDW